jgi:hypothetical protein
VEKQANTRTVNGCCGIGPAIQKKYLKFVEEFQNEAARNTIERHGRKQERFPA